MKVSMRCSGMAGLAVTAWQQRESEFHVYNEEVET